MDVDVLLFGKLRELAGASEESFGVEKGACLADLFAVMAVRHGPSLQRELASPERFMILVNGCHYNSLNGLQTVLKQGDTVAIVPAVIGG